MTRSGPEAGQDSRPGDSDRIRRRRTAWHLMLSVMTLLIFGSAILALSWQDDGDDPDPDPTPTGSPSPTVAEVQPVILIQANGDAGASANMVTAMGTGDDPDAILISLPADLMVTAPGVDTESIRATVSSLDTLRAPSAVSATLGVRIDGSWRLDRKALAGLVDSVNGVTVNQAEPIRFRDGDGDVVLALRSGRQTLTGTEASWYALGSARDDTSAAAMARVNAVFSQAIEGMPDDPTAVRETLTSLGALAPSTISAQQLAEYLVELGNAVRDGRIAAVDLPTTQIPLGRTDYSWTNYNEATPLLRRSLPLAQWEAAGARAPRVLVRSGSDRPGLIGSTRRGIESLGYVFVEGRGTPTPHRQDSIVQTRGTAEWGRRVAVELRIPTRSVTMVPNVSAPPEGQPWADVDVILGQDYDP